MMKYVYIIVFIGLLLFSACTVPNVIQDNTGAPSDLQTPPQGMPVLNATPGTKDPSANLPQDNGVQISASELFLHNKESDCWVSYEGKVYDVTKFLPFHPGGAAAIVKYCGTASEFEKGFTTKHGTSKVNVLFSQIYKGNLV
jgi:cytochrome b involved in lipid metabolism